MTRKGRLALVVEDNPPSRDLMAYLLRASGFQVLTCSDGSDAVDLARRHQPDVVVMDLQLDHMGGLEASVLMSLDPALATIPRVAVTAFAMSGDRERVLASGFHGYMSKPIEPTTFAAQVEDAIRLTGGGAD